MSDSKALSHLLSLPNEITVKIFGHTKPEDICSISLANRKFYKLFHDDYVWQLMCNTQYPTSRILEAQKDLDKDGTLGQLFSTIPESKAATSLRLLYPNTHLDAELSNNNALSTESNEMVWKILYKYISNPISYIAKERGITLLNFLDGLFVRGQKHWATEIGESAYGQIIHLYYVWWFDIKAVIKCVHPGTYDIVWRLKVDEGSYGLGGLNFKTQVIANSYDEALHTPERVVREINYVSSSWLFNDDQSKGIWIEYCLPYQIVVPEERVIDGEYIWYDIKCKIFDTDGFQRNGL
ncbi:16889_t:CDS:2 [Acaulospora morrowiae]|uniref:16889_t:CDS:1 n=1 Tax=Acaulospora morrowiae TaxID=94023 RepID=A0A9N8VHG0_9GLOM|nr:16889_t:CDS:2 [Acaulospora morrowiae]